MRTIRIITLLALLAAMLMSCGQAASTPAPTQAPAAPTQAAAAPTQAPAAPTAAPAPTQAAAEPTPASSAELPAYTGGPAELRFGWWGNDDRAARTQKVIELFQAAYPDIKVTGEPN